MKKKINIDRKRISSEDIVSRRNFDQLLSQFPGFVKPPFYKTGWFITTVASVAVLATVTTTVLMNNGEETEKQVAMEETSSPPVEVEELTDDVFMYDEDTPCVQPPNKKIDVAKTEYKVDASSGGEFDHPTGSHISIPANAFVSEEGEPIKGEVELQYREFHDPVDFLVSGIPMEYDSAGTTYTFESAGMIEIYGFQNGKPLTIAPEKSINISLQPKDGSTSFNLYELDTTNKQWNYKGKPEIVRGEADESTGIVAEHSQEDPELVKQEEIITQKVMERKQQMNLAKSQLDKKTNEIVEFKKKAPEQPKTSKNKDRQFELDVDPKEFPELSSYENVTFEVDAHDKNFSSAVYEVEWENVALTEKDKGKDYYLTLYKGSAKKIFLVHPVFSGNDYKKAMALFEQKFKVYEKDLKKKEAEEAELKALYEEKVMAWEKEVREQERIKKARQEAAKIDQMNNNAGSVMARAFNVTNFGTWNCDKATTKPQGEKVKAMFADKTGATLPLRKVFLIEKDKNAIFSYNKSDFENFKYDPEEENTLVAFTPDQQLAIYRPMDFNMKNPKGKFTFEMDLVDVNIMNLDEVKNIINP